MEKMDNNRYYGLDILRIISMLGVIGLHILSRGGVLVASETNHVSSLEAWMLNIGFYCSINIFAILTGYLYTNKKIIKKKNIVNLIFIALFYNISILLVYGIFDPSVFSDKQLMIKSIFQALAGSHWYITSYIFLFFLIPFINEALHSLNKNQHKKLIYTCVLFLSVITSFGFKDYFAIAYGYSPFWLVVCYFIGAYIKKYYDDRNFAKKKMLGIFLINVVLLFASKKMIAVVTLYFLGKTVGECNFITYVSPFILINSVLIFFVFKNIKLKNKKVIRGILSLSGSAFSVYIAHGHLLLWNNVIFNKFAFIAKSHIFLFTEVIAVVMIIYLLWWIIDQLRVVVFKVFKVDVLSEKIGTWLEKYFV